MFHQELLTFEKPLKHDFYKNWPCEITRSKNSFPDLGNGAKRFLIYELTMNYCVDFIDYYAFFWDSKGGSVFYMKKNHSNFGGPYLKFFNTSTIRGIAILKLADLPSIFCLGPKRLTFFFEFLQSKQEKNCKFLAPNFHILVHNFF